MEYDRDFIKCFMERTLVLANDYKSEFDATLLLNCLLGLLVVPKEHLIESIPDTPFELLKEWGIDPASIKRYGRCEYGCLQRPNLRQLVKKLRNAVAHFKIMPYHREGVVVGFSFRDRDKFHAKLSLAEIRNFVSQLSKHIAQVNASKDNLLH